MDEYSKYTMLRFKNYKLEYLIDTAPESVVLSHNQLDQVRASGNKLSIDPWDAEIHVDSLPKLRLVFQVALVGGGDFKRINNLAGNLNLAMPRSLNFQEFLHISSVRTTHVIGTTAMVRNIKTNVFL
jgi:hypothetical protein